MIDRHWFWQRVCLAVPIGLLLVLWGLGIAQQFRAERVHGGGITVSLTNDARAWDLSYQTGEGTWVLYLTKWTTDRLESVQLDLATNAQRQLWRLQGRAP